MNAELSLVDWHKQTYGHRPALFLARFASTCCWCGGEIAPGDGACYWPEHVSTVGHEDCLVIVWRSHL